MKNQLRPDRPLDVSMERTLPSVASLRLDAERATYGSVAGFLPREGGRSPILLLRVIRSLWQPDTHRSSFLKVRWPAGGSDYSGISFPSPNLDDRLIVFTSRELAGNSAGDVSRTSVEQIGLPLPFGAVGVRDGYTLPLSWLRRDKNDRHNTYISGPFWRAPKFRSELFAAKLPELLQELERYAELLTARRTRPTQAGLRLPLGL